ncbi:MAG: hypothetical protein MUO72_09970 [Bacteroidales bacterium]|nr:hypothetical protein [Bacteroidales bacterium]
MPYVLVYSLINYFLGQKIPGSKHKIALFRTGIIINLSQLIILKYSSFTIDPFLQLFNSNIYVSRLAEIMVPVGISYFTLQGIGFLINVKMGWEKPEKNLLKFLLYITFYPKFLSGPIERSNHFIPQLGLDKKINEQQMAEGLRIVLIGVFKKVAVANQLAPYVINSFTNTAYSDGFTSWIIFILHPLYLYFDFSGYTDIAIGIAKMFGIDLLPNFNRPFFSENMTTFWKRFHISLSSWFNDYMFKQTSFRYRKWGVWASVYAIFITWMLFGIWHGAGWTFMLIGVLQAIAINYEYFTKKLRVKLFAKVPIFLNTWFSRIVTYLFYCLCMVLFFSPDVKTALTFLTKLTRFSGETPFDDISLKPFGVLIFIPALLFLELLQNDYNNVYLKLEAFWSGEAKSKRVLRWTVYSILITIIYVTGLKSQQFVYANF